MANKQKKEQVDFGFKRVAREAKQSMVYDVFSSVAGKYDIMNDAMSFGLHRIWKDKMLSYIQPRNDTKMLDLAGGTGDIGFRYLKKAYALNLDASVIITDVNEHMLEEGKARAVDQNILRNVEWAIVDAQEIPYDDNSFDFVTISFGIRNVTDRDKALTEIFRVLKPGGMFVCMEFSHVDHEILAKCYDLFSFNILPKMGKLIAGDEDSYRYLVESIREFPSREVFMAMMRTAGFESVSCETLSQGVVALYAGVKPS